MKFKPHPIYGILLIAAIFGPIGYWAYTTYTKIKADQFEHKMRTVVNPYNDPYDGKEWTEANGLRMICKEEAYASLKMVVCREKCRIEHSGDGRAINECMDRDRGVTGTPEERARKRYGKIPD